MTQLAQAVLGATSSMSLQSSGKGKENESASWLAVHLQASRQTEHFVPFSQTGWDWLTLGFGLL